MMAGWQDSKMRIGADACIYVWVAVWNNLFCLLFFLHFVLPCALHLVHLLRHRCRWWAGCSVYPCWGEENWMSVSEGKWKTHLIRLVFSFLFDFFHIFSFYYSPKCRPSFSRILKMGKRKGNTFDVKATYFRISFIFFLLHSMLSPLPGHECEKG